MSSQSAEYDARTIILLNFSLIMKMFFSSREKQKSTTHTTLARNKLGYTEPKLPKYDVIACLCACRSKLMSIFIE